MRVERMDLGGVEYICECEQNTLYEMPQELIKYYFKKEIIECSVANVCYLMLRTRGQALRDSSW